MMIMRTPAQVTMAFAESSEVQLAGVALAQPTMLIDELD